MAPRRNVPNSENVDGKCLNSIGTTVLNAASFGAVVLLTGAVLLHVSYDASGRLTAIEDAFANVTTIERDGPGKRRLRLRLGFISSRSLNGANFVSYGYDNDGLLSSAGEMTLAWDAINALLNSTKVGSVSSSLAYNGFGEPASETTSHTDSTTGTTSKLYDVSYTRDSLGRIKTKTDTMAGQSATYAYAYDSRGRLTDVTKDGAPSLGVRSARCRRSDEGRERRRRRRHR